MKYMCLLLAVLLCGTALFYPAKGGAQTPVFDWSLLSSGSWEENKTLHNRLELKFDLLDFSLRGQVLDRRPLNFELTSPWGDSEKWVTHFQGGLYHRPTGSRLLVGALDEWGVSARIRNPWIRSPPYAENHKPLIADLKTAASSTKTDEAYLYLSTPFISFPAKIDVRGFLSAQTEIEDLDSRYNQTAASAGLDLSLPNKSNLLLEGFYTTALLPPTKVSTWFSYPPQLPERHFELYGAGLLYSSSFLSIGSDFALSDTFAWGTDIYFNFGFSVSPLLPRVKNKRIPRPFTFSFALDAAGERFVFRDGSDYNAGFRTAAKIEVKGAHNSLFRISSTLRGHGFGKDFTRSSTGIYYRFPAVTTDSSFINLTRISISADRNADNPQKISDRLYGYIGLSLNLNKIGVKTPFGIYFNGSIRGLSSAEGQISPFPIPTEPWNFEDSALSLDFTFSPSIFQFKTRIGYSNNAKNDEKWDFSISAAARFKSKKTKKSPGGRLSLKAASPDLPDKWNFTVSWRLEM